MRERRRLIEHVLLSVWVGLSLSFSLSLSLFVGARVRGWAGVQRDDIAALALDLEDLMQGLTERRRSSVAPGVHGTGASAGAGGVGGVPPHLRPLLQGVVESGLQLVTAVTNHFGAQYVDITALTVHRVSEVVRSVPAPRRGREAHAQTGTHCSLIERHTDTPTRRIYMFT
jgi:hypothetical protein